MKNLKNNCIKSVLILVLIVTSSCQDLLEFQPSTSLPDTQIFTTAPYIELAVVGVYNSAQSGFYAGNVIRGYPFGAAHVEQGDNRGEDVISTQQFYGITYDASYDPTTANNDFMWQTLYALINSANVVLDGLETVTTDIIPQTAIDNYKGEMLFLRALAHHELLKNFARPYSDNPTAVNGGVVIRTEPIRFRPESDAASLLGRSTVQQVYDQILADLNAAETLLPETRSSSTNITRATKAAAVAIKTRVYLHMGNWASVVTEGNKLADELSAPFSPAAGYGSYALTASPMGPFTSAGSKSNSESIFSIENNDVDNAGVNGALPTMYSASKAPITGRALICISPVLWNNSWFLSNDLRKSSLMVDDDIAGPGRAAKYTKKYSDVTARTDNAPVIRYAEVLLNMAEAIQRQAGAPDARALALLNAVRNRAVTNVADQFTLGNFATANDLTLAVLRERRIEFVCEGLRWGDIHRLAQDPNFPTGGIPIKALRTVTNWSSYYTGNPATSFPIQASISYSNYRFLWPIPASETSVNPVLATQQNPGF
ncbi:MAG TPA: RagB/SusD family nutrient uptake outer membrane protein [Cyclobacteriaceae bacterium]